MQNRFNARSSEVSRGPTQRWRRNDIWMARFRAWKRKRANTKRAQRNQRHQPSNRLFPSPFGSRLSHISVSRRPGPPPVLVCLCHFRDTVLRTLRAKLIVIWSPVKLMVIWCSLCLLAPTDRRHFFRPNCCIKTYPLRRTMNSPRFDLFMDGNVWKLAFDEISSLQLWVLFLKKKKKYFIYKK